MTLTAHEPEPVDEALLALLRTWLPERRWFPAKGTPAELSLVGALRLGDAPDDADGVGVRVLLVRARAGSIDAVLQVPLVLESGHAEGGPGDVVGVLGGRTVRDGAAHPAFVRAWLAVAEGRPHPPRDLDPATARAVAGEQSNSSVVLSPAAAPVAADARRGGSGRAILKVLRAVQPGDNPDVDVPRALVDAGVASVPAPLAWLRATWPAADGSRATGYLGALAAFVDDARDGFELACDAARAGQPFDDLARDLGRVTATVHHALAGAFPLVDAPDGPEQVARAIEQRHAWAVSAVPDLARFAPTVQGVAARVRALPATPPRQRVHGDLHLGQVLRTPTAWYVTDFEGEPLAPLDQRTRPDLAVRDVAGLLRSIDYAAAVGGGSGPAASAWAVAARAALLEGYAEGHPAASAPPTGGDADLALLTLALELDKTLYEAVYESRNRPSWLPIPVGALERLAADVG